VSLDTDRIQIFGTRFSLSRRRAAHTGRHARFSIVSSHCLTQLHDGAFPIWLAPVQVLVVPVSDGIRAYAEQIVRRLRSKLVRAEVAPAGETVARNIRDAGARKVPSVLVVGRREQADGSVTLRRRGVDEQVTLAADDFERQVLDAIGRRCRTIELR
jgi:threonyl-tRNA synthetase